MGLNNIAVITIIMIISFLNMTIESTRPPFSCDTSNTITSTLQFCNLSLPINQRVEDLISRLNIDEKISQLGNTAPAIPRLNISAYEWWSEALHGISIGGEGMTFNGTIKAATQFPQVIITASTFDEHLWYRIAQAIAREIRGVYNTGELKGMTFWAPNVNILRDPRWGRAQETAGEDPMMVGKYGVAYVRGLQGDSFKGGKLKDGHLQTSACCKHFAAQDLDNWKGYHRFTFDAQVTPQDLADSFQPPFKACVEEGKATSIMCAYSRLNGVSNCANYDLLTTTARGQWGFNGYIVSDCDAVRVMQRFHGYTDEDAVAASIKAGMDVNCGSFVQNYTRSALEKKKLLESDIDRALRNIFSIRMRLGLFNGDPKKLEYGEISSAEVCSQEHHNLALEAARNGIVLLKNSAKLLPLSMIKTTSLAVIGPKANDSELLIGSYSGFPCKNVSLLQGFQRVVKNIGYHPGCNFVNCTSAAIDEAVDVAKKSQYVVLIMGLDQDVERESWDREELGLPGQQENLITAVAQAAAEPVILVLTGGGPIDISFAKKNPKIGGIFWIGYPGEAGADALAQIIFGEHNPGGRLPATWYPKEFIKIPMSNMNMRPNSTTGYPGRTYRFYNGPKVYEFGYGLSYTSYSYNIASVSNDKLNFNAVTADKAKSHSSLLSIAVSDIGSEVCDKAKFSVKVAVKNKGKVAGKHPVLLFLTPSKVRDDEVPRKQLIGFKSVHLDGKQKTTIKFTVSPCEHFARADKNGISVIDEGKYFLVVGNKKHAITVII